MKKLLCILVPVLLFAGGIRGENAYLFRRLDASTGLPDNNVRAVTMLPDGVMGILTSSYLCLFDGASSWNYRWDPVKIPYSEYSGQCGIRFDDDSGLILLRSRDRIWAFDRGSSAFLYEGLPQMPDPEPASVSDDAASRTETLTARDGGRWFLSDKHIVHYHPVTGKLTERETIPPGSDDLFTSIALDADGNLWIGTARSGVRILYADGRREELPYLETVDGKRVYPHSDIAYIYADPRGGIWIATQAEGLLYWYPGIYQFRTVNNATLSAGRMSDESVKCLAEAPDGSVLVGTIHGLQQYDPSVNAIREYRKELRDKLIISLFVDSRDRVWVGTFYDGLYCVEAGRLRHYSWDEPVSVDVSYLKGTPNRNCVRCLYEDGEGRFWISVYGGVGQFDPETGRIDMLRDRHPELDSFKLVRDILQMKDGDLVGVGDNGRFRYDPASDVVRKNASEEAFTQTNQLERDSDGRYWLAEVDGLVLLSEDGTRLASTGDGMAMSLARDYAGGYWTASTSDISRVNPVAVGETGLILSRITFGAQDGIDCGSFFQKSVLRHSDGHLYFGGASGFCIIDPSVTYLTDPPLAPRISAFRVDGELRPVEPSLMLRPRENSLSLEFSNLNYANPAHSVYRYRLEGLEKNWTLITARPLGRADYNYLQPGKYTFTVMASNNGVEWSEAVRLPLTVKPPFYKTIWARLLIFLAGLLFLALVFIYLYRRQLHRLQEASAAEQHRQEEELNQMKFRFFTNISHELRTPLSLIILPLESLMKEKEGTGEYGRLKTMHRNAKSLLDLVNHLLDFRKVEMGGEKLQLRLGSIREFAENLLDAFQPAAEEREISLSLEDETTNPMMEFDSNMMQKVINNLVSNALKFTEAGGAITLRLSGPTDGKMCIEVADTGIGIPSDDLPHVFDRFFRSGNASSSTGSGIGLSLVKQYVELHGGTVSARSEVGKGSTFTVLVPVGNAGTAPLPDEESEEDVDVDGRKRILVVDDNADFRNYLVDELGGTYVVASACDGEDALRKMPSFRPDIVVSDVMMPKVDGFALIRRIKEDVETSHIPVILLTARLSEEVRTEGYEYGADAYLTKPFLMEMLQARIRNLLEDREKRIRSFSGTAEVSPMHVTITTVDQKLMARITEKLEANLDNPEYSVEQMASDVGMHRMNLYRKIQSLYGMTPSEFIRTMRLKRAAQILTADPNLTVSEVADMVGFNTPKYFTKYFKELFGVLPSQYNRK